MLPIASRIYVHLLVICNPLSIGWLMKGQVQKLVVVISGVESGESLERWAFQVHHERPVEPLRDGDR